MHSEYFATHAGLVKTPTYYSIQPSFLFQIPDLVPIRNLDCSTRYVQDTQTQSCVEVRIEIKGKDGVKIVRTVM